MRKILFTSYICNQNDSFVQEIIREWAMLNPTYKIIYFSDNDVDLFFSETKYNETYKKMRNGVAKADFFRICYINKYGGFWFDIDLKPLKIDILDAGGVRLFDAGYKNISYMFIGGDPSQKLFDDVIVAVEKNILDNIPEKKKHVMNITGPRIIQNILCGKLGIINKDGCLPGRKEGEIYLKGTDYEFIYQKIVFSEHKTSLYQKLQKKYMKIEYQKYNFI